MLTGIAKPSPMLPCEGDRIWELMPISSPLQIHERATGVALVDGRVGLNEVLVLIGVGLGGPWR